MQLTLYICIFFFFFQAEDGIRDLTVTGVQTCALPICEKWRTGKHTSTAAELVPVAGVGYVVDTPGLREIGAWGIDPNELGACFPEFRPYLDQCRFDNCRHLVEPGCAVRGAPAGGGGPGPAASGGRGYGEGR